MPFSEKEVTHILAVLRAGETVTISSPNGRCATTFSWRDGRWTLDCVEEGLTWDENWSEDKLRALIAASDDDAFARLLARKIES